MQSHTYTYHLTPQELKKTEHTWLKDEAKRSNDFCYTREDKRCDINDEIRKNLENGSFGGFNGSYSFAKQVDKKDITFKLNTIFPELTCEDGNNKLIKHLSSGPLNLIYQTLTTYFANKKSDLKITLNEELDDDVFFQEIHYDREHGNIIQKLKIANIPLLNNDGKCIGYIRNKLSDKPSEFIFQLTDKGFKLTSIGTDSKLIHDIFKGIAPIDQLSLCEKYQDEIFWLQPEEEETLQDSKDYDQDIIERQNRQQIEGCQSRLNYIRNFSDNIYIPYQKILNNLRDLKNENQIGRLLLELEQIRLDIEHFRDNAQLEQESAINSCKLALNILAEASNSTQYLFMQETAKKAHEQAKTEFESLKTKKQIDFKQIRDLTAATIESATVVNKPHDANAIQRLNQATDSLPKPSKAFHCFKWVSFVATVACIVAMPFTAGLSLFGLSAVAWLGISAGFTFGMGLGALWAAKPSKMTNVFFKVQSAAKEGTDKHNDLQMSDIRPLSN